MKLRTKNEENYNSYNDYAKFKKDFINRDGKRFGKVRFLKSIHNKFWKHVIEKTDLYIKEKGGDPNVSASPTY